MSCGCTVASRQADVCRPNELNVCGLIHCGRQGAIGRTCDACCNQCTYLTVVDHRVVCLLFNREGGCLRNSQFNSAVPNAWYGIPCNGTHVWHARGGANRVYAPAGAAASSSRLPRWRRAFPIAIKRYTSTRTAPPANRPACLHLATCSSHAVTTMIADPDGMVGEL